MQLSPLKSSHYSATADILAEYWKERGMKNYPKKWALNYLKKGHAHEMEKDTFFTIREKNHVIGNIALIEFAGKVAEIRDFVLKKEHRNQKLGEKALKQLETYAQKRKIRKLFASVLTRNQKFFERNGYHKEGLLKHHFKRNEHVLVMSKFL